MKKIVYLSLLLAAFSCKKTETVEKANLVDSLQSVNHNTKTENIKAVENYKNDQLLDSTHNVLSDSTKIIYDQKDPILEYQQLVDEFLNNPKTIKIYEHYWNGPVEIINDQTFPRGIGTYLDEHGYLFVDFRWDAFPEYDGTLYYPDGAIFKGTIRPETKAWNNKAKSNSYGTITYPNGDKYVGYFDWFRRRYELGTLTKKGKNHSFVNWQSIPN